MPNSTDLSPALDRLLLLQQQAQRYQFFARHEVELHDDVTENLEKLSLNFRGEGGNAFRQLRECVLVFQDEIVDRVRVIHAHDGVQHGGTKKVGATFEENRLQHGKCRQVANRSTASLGLRNGETRHLEKARSHGGGRPQFLRQKRAREA